MESDEIMTIVSSMQDGEFDDIDYGCDIHHHQPHNLSRLSRCTSSIYTNEDDDEDNEESMKMFMSRLSIESSDGDADEEFSDENEFKELPELSSDSDKEPGFYSLPATPRHRRTRRGSMTQQQIGVKDYASENEARKNIRRRRIVRERFTDGKIVNKKEQDQENFMNYRNTSFSGESESGGCGSGVVVVTRPKGGRRSLCMGWEEMKACRDLGFELEHERMLEIPNRVSLSGSTTLDTSSGGNSPISNWRISSPGDDPRDVKARLKVWAQAVALASASRNCT